MTEDPAEIPVASPYESSPGRKVSSQTDLLTTITQVWLEIKWQIKIKYLVNGLS